MRLLRGHPETRRSRTPLLVSIAVHAVMIVVLAQVLALPAQIGRLFERVTGDRVPEEHIAYVRVEPEPRGGGGGGGGTPGGDASPTAPRAPRPLLAPSVVPSAIPAVPPRGEGPAGRGAGSGWGDDVPGPVRGVRPAYTDPRVWLPAAPEQEPPKTSAERLDSALTIWVRRHNDSLAIAGTPREPGDWTFERGGRTYGIDRDYIRLGRFSIPTAILALLPLNVQGNPTTIERERQIQYMHDDIAYQAQRAMNEAEFRDAVRRIRERKDRERARRLAAEKDGGR